MVNRRLTITLFIGLFLIVAARAGADDADTLTTLWRIGNADADTAGLALAPDDHRRFARDFASGAFFVVGPSTPEADWPYVQPGPIDTWASTRTHTFTILFGLHKPRSDADYRLVIDLVDTHNLFPPELEIICNDRVIARHATEPGGSDDSIGGESDRGRPRKIEIEIAADALNEGLNQLDIRIISGSWMLYDALRLDGPVGAAVTEVPDGCYIRSVTPRPCLAIRDGEMRQLIMLDVVRTGNPVAAQCKVNGEPHPPLDLRTGRQEVEIYAPAVDHATPVMISLTENDDTLAVAETTINHVRPWIVHLLHFSHLDIGYTHLQEEVEQLQMQFIDQAQELIRQTDDYPVEARFRWVPEGLWVVESYLKQADETKRREFIDNVKAGRIWVTGLYDQALTGLHSEEELFALTEYANHLRREYDLDIDAAMITDVPGYTWGLVPVLARTGVKYLSLGPNPDWRIGRTRVWEDRPFYWVSPCGQYKVLCWMSGGYGWFRAGLDKDLEGQLAQSRLLNTLDQLQKSSYPYDLLHLRYDVHADNGHPDPNLPDTVQRWNDRFAYPKLVITTPSVMFAEFEQRYGDQLPVRQGDFTPYWEDGAASTAADTALNRRTAERIIQAQTLWAMLDPVEYPAQTAYDAWRDAILYDEHTWGAHNSISEPDSEFAVTQAARKQRFALDADAASRELLDTALARRRASNRNITAIEVFNTCSWPRTDLVIMPKDTDLVGDVVRTAGGAIVPSQRLSSGELAFLATDVPALGSARFTVQPGRVAGIGSASAKRISLSNDLLELTLNPDTGGIASIHASDISSNLVDEEATTALNDYIYVTGNTPDEQQFVEAGTATIEIVDNGPFVATLRVTSPAPGTSGLTRQISLIDGLNRVDIADMLDKVPIRDKEGVHLAFPFNIPDPDVHMDMPWAVVRPEKDQIEGACKNFFAVQRWVDVSNLEYGVTWATIDAPLVQMGEIRTDIGPYVASPESWLNHISPSATLFSYIMNNYWETNYKADQGGRAQFCYSIRPHTGPYDQTRAARFGIERSRPLIAVPTRADGPPALPSLFTIDNPGVVATSVKPSRDGNAMMVRLFAVSGKPEQARLIWPGPQYATLYLSDANESVGPMIDVGAITLPAYGITTVRAVPASRVRAGR